MKAFIVESPGHVRLADVPIPEIGPEEALVKIAYSGICATDFSIVSGNTSLVRDGLIQYPVRIGHEWSGTVELVGENVSCFTAGDRVVSDSGVSCGRCESCLHGDYTSCRNIRSVGTINCWDGSFAEYMAMPARHLYKLPDNISLIEGALIEPCGIALAGINRATIDHKSMLLIIGTGAIGMASVVFAKYFGARKILLGGRTDSKLEVGKKLGADVTINVTRENLRQIVMEQTVGKGADVVIESSGNVQTISQCIDLGAQRGKIVLIGFYEADIQNFSIDPVVTKELQLKGVMGEFGLAGKVIDILKTGRIDLRPLVSRVVSIDNALEIMKHADKLKGSSIKILAEMGGGK